MEFLTQLWMPIVLSAVLVFVASAVSHMLVPYRRKEWSAAPDPQAVQQAFRGAAPGLYVFPAPADPKDRGKPEHLKRWADGPSGFLALVPPGPIRMGRNLGLSLLVNLFVSAFTAYVTYKVFGPGASYRAVFRVVGSIGFMAYAVGPLYEGIWYWKPWRSFAMVVLDALVFGSLMAGTFGWLWPR